MLQAKKAFLKSKAIKISNNVKSFSCNTNMPSQYFSSESGLRHTGHENQTIWFLLISLIKEFKTG